MVSGSQPLPSASCPSSKAICDNLPKGMYAQIAIQPNNSLKRRPPRANSDQKASDQYGVYSLQESNLYTTFKTVCTQERAGAMTNLKRLKQRGGHEQQGLGPVCAILCGCRPARSTRSPTWATGSNAVACRGLSTRIPLVLAQHQDGDQILVGELPRPLTQPLLAHCVAQVFLKFLLLIFRFKACCSFRNASI